MVLATGLAFFMLWFGGGGGLINMSYGMNAMVHNTSWVTAHFHLIFGGTVVIMYFAIAYAIWPSLTGRTPRRRSRHQRLQLWLWFVGMMVMTLPWHYLGLHGQWRRVATSTTPTRSSPVGTVGHRLARRRHHPARERVAVRLEPACNSIAPAPSWRRACRPLYALAVHPPERVPAALNGFALWNVLVLVLMIARLWLSDRPVLHHRCARAIVHRVDGAVDR